VGSRRPGKQEEVTLGPIHRWRPETVDGSHYNVEAQDQLRAYVAGYIRSCQDTLKEIERLRIPGRDIITVTIRIKQSLDEAHYTMRSLQRLKASYEAGLDLQED
jgi:hypothetical protein